MSGGESRGKGEEEISGLPGGVGRRGVWGRGCERGRVRGGE